MYHIIKKSRTYDGKPYSGPSTDNQPAEYQTLYEALKARRTLTNRNPVGWDIYHSCTGRIITLEEEAMIKEKE